MAEGLRVVHFVNQFFGQIGGEEQAGVGPQQREGAIGPARAADAALKGRGQVVATVICGDNYIAENTEAATKAILDMVREHRPDFVLAGPAFNAGRYGMACGAVAVAVQRELGIPVITGMFKENPGVDVYRRDVLIVETGDTAAQMAQVINKMVGLAERMVAGEQIKNAAAEGCFPRGIVVNEFSDRNAGQRAVAMLVKKLRGEPFQTEVHVPQYPKIAPPPAVKDLSRARVAIVTDGGIVLKGNPDKIERSNATRWAGYSIDGLDTLDPSQYEVVHAGYDTRFVAEDPNRLIPVDTLRELEKQGAIGELHDVFFTTTGVGTTLENSRRMGAEMAKQLQEAGVDAVILTSTWGTSTRSGAAIAAELEKAGLPTVQIATMIPVVEMVGVNRVVVGAGITHPTGDASLDDEREKDLRKAIVERALKAVQTEVEGDKAVLLDLRDQV